MSLITRSGSLPKGFVLAKPIAQESYDESIVYGLESHRRLKITRKRDGWKMLAHFDSRNKIHLYTDGVNEIDSRFDHIKEELKSLKIPKNTLLVGEAIVDIDDNDDIGKVISIFHSNEEKSLFLQKAYGRIHFMLFAGISLSDSSKSVWPFGLSASYYLHNPCKGLQYVFIVPTLSMTFDEAKKMVVEKGWEGLVLYDKDYQLTYRTDGKSPKRPEGCYKWKPILEDDFIVRLRLLRSGTDVLKEVVIRQIDPATGKEFICGKLGSFTNQMRQELAEVKLPFVVQARFDMRFPKSGKIRNARFLRVRDDKPVDQCMSPKSYPEADYPKVFVMGHCGKCEMTVDFYQDGGGWECERCGHWVEEVTDIRED